MDTGSYPRVKSGQGVTLTPHPFSCRGQERVELYHFSPLWAVWPVQILIACTRVHFTFYIFRESSIFPLIYFCCFLILPHTYFPSRNSLVTQLFLLPSQNSTFLVISSCDLTHGTSPTNSTLPHTQCRCNKHQCDNQQFACLLIVMPTIMFMYEMWRGLLITKVFISHYFSFPWGQRAGSYGGQIDMQFHSVTKKHRLLT